MSKTILSVDNDEPVRKIIVDIVESLGYRCVEAINARQGLEILHNEVIDLILLDTHMGAVHGNHFLKFIKEKEKIKFRFKNLHLQALQAHRHYALKHLQQHTQPAM